jgi:hypothetical protein
MSEKTVGPHPFINDKNIEKIKNGKPFIVKNSGLPSVGWQEVMNLLDNDTQNTPDLVRNVGQYGFMLINAQRIESVKLFLDELYTIFEKTLEFSPEFFDQNGQSNEHQVYISLTTEPDSRAGKHTDYSNVVFWQLNGVSRWLVYGEDGIEVELDEVLSPGDLLYCPETMQHNVIPMTPRCGVSLGLGKLKV